MLRLQTPLDERYTAAPPDELASRIDAAKAALGDRLFILGHHYQRDEIIRWPSSVRKLPTSCSAASTSWRSRPTS